MLGEKKVKPGYGEKDTWRDTKAQREEKTTGGIKGLSTVQVPWAEGSVCTQTPAPEVAPGGSPRGPSTSCLDCRPLLSSARLPGLSFSSSPFSILNGN